MQLEIDKLEDMRRDIRTYADHDTIDNRILGIKTAMEWADEIFGDGK